MKILYVTGQDPGVACGTSTRMDIHLQVLGAFGDVDMIVVTDQELVAVDAHRPVMPIHPQPNGRVSRVLGEFLAFAGLVPHNVDIVAARGTRRRINAAMANRPDVIWSYGLPAFSVVPAAMKRDAIVYTDFVDFEGHRDLAMVDLAKHRLAGLRRFLRRRNIPALRRATRIAVGQSTRCFICSDSDREALGAAGVEVVPNAIGQFVPALDRSLVASAPVFLFVGTLWYLPNQDAVEWLVAEIWPLVRLQLPDAELRVIGRGYSGLLPADASGVTMMGEVGDLRPHYSDAWATVIPLRCGSGTRIKALEAWANHVPVVSTRKGVEGLGAADRDTVLIADTAREFADRVVEIASHRVLAQDVATRGHDLWRRRYTTEAVSEQLRQLLETDLATRGSGPHARRRRR